ncbi:pro-sigmaK processing inhibitor BofA family protein [Candidatus Micrarchaeota archaeon]|nr:pro-sigmaK processing inhibitor BofA family protein [Candidatus Micrarchaeota archaeon]
MADPTPVVAQAVGFPFVGILLAVGLIILAIIVVKLLKNFLANSVMGVIALLVISYLADVTGYAGIKVPITIVTVIISGILGLAGVGLLIVLKLLGIVIQ